MENSLGNVVKRLMGAFLSNKRDRFGAPTSIDEARGKELVGIDEIRSHLGLLNNFTVLEWRILHGLPMEKRGIWRASKAEVEEWRVKNYTLREEN